MGQQMESKNKAEPKTGTVVDVNGLPCPAANASSYPLYADCVNCEHGIRCADGTAEWCHVSDYRGTCS